MIVAALLVKWSPAGDSYAVAIGTKVVVYKLAVSTVHISTLWSIHVVNYHAVSSECISKEI